MPRVAVVFTGGTISAVFDPVAGGNIQVLDSAAILARTQGLDEIAEVVAIDRGRTPASHFAFPQLIEIANVVRSALADPTVDGAVVVQGTDTIEETSFTWDLLLEGPKPVVVTGAMRTSDAPDYDGPANIRNAVRAAAAPELRDTGTVVCLAGTIEAADDVQKSHTTAFETFQSPNFGSIARVGGDGVALLRARGPRRSIPTHHAAERVYLITATIGADAVLMDAAIAAGADAIVVAATGTGNTHPSMLAAAERAMDAGIPVALASRCPAGRPTGAYAFPGGGANWLRAGALPVGHLCAIKARIALALGLGAGLDRDRLVALLADPGPVPGGH
jgi:L-asparaginase